VAADLVPRASVQRLVAALLLVALVPLAHRVDAFVTVGMVASVRWATIALEAVRHGEARREIRYEEHQRHSGG
jgi:hypothetical protein